jgi:hypothetical protein
MAAYAENIGLVAEDEAVRRQADRIQCLCDAGGISLAVFRQFHRAVGTREQFDIEVFLKAFDQAAHRTGRHVELACGFQENCRDGQRPRKSEWR